MKTEFDTELQNARKEVEVANQRFALAVDQLKDELDFQGRRVRQLAGELRRPLEYSRANPYTVGTVAAFVGLIAYLLYRRSSENAAVVVVEETPSGTVSVSTAEKVA